MNSFKKYFLKYFLFFIGIPPARNKPPVDRISNVKFEAHCAQNLVNNSRVLLHILSLLFLDIFEGSFVLRISLCTLFFVLFFIKNLKILIIPGPEITDSASIGFFNLCFF